MTGHRIIAAGAPDTLGEGPVWSARLNRLLWVDIVGQRVRSVDVDQAGGAREWRLEEPVGWVAERQGRTDLLAGLKSGVASIALDPLEVTPLVAPEPDRPQNRLNDAKVDAAGRLWFGSKDDSDQQASGALYRLDPDLSVRRMDDGYRVTNGPAFSPDGRWLYHNDSGLGLVYRFPLHADGTLGPREPFVTFAEGWGYPDGMTVDAEGFLWIAHWGGARVSRFDPAGRLDRACPLPATNVTSCTFGGAGLDRLFVTSAALASPGGPADGALFELDAGVRGLAPVPFAG